MPDSLLEKYRALLPLHGVTSVEGLGEGNTPLVKGSLGGTNQLYFKMEQLNPTGSFKDRFAVLETALMKAKGIGTFLATSSGNTGSALAAYSARRGLQCFIFVNENIPENKFGQMLAYGATIIRVKDFGVSQKQSSMIFDRLRCLAEGSRIPLVISAYKYSPVGMDGLKTIAYEVVEQLGSVPDQIFVPVGGGGLLTGIWRGFLHLQKLSLIDRMPRLNVVQPTLNDTVVTSLNNKLDEAREVNTTTLISGLAVQVDIDATSALRAVGESGGRGYLIDDENIREVQSQLARTEGVFVEAAGATSVAGYLKALSLGHIRSDEMIVCILTGNGLKEAQQFVEKRRIPKIELNDITPELIESETTRLSSPQL